MKKYNTKNCGSWDYADSMADSIMTKLDETMNLSDEKYEAMYNEICDTLEDMDDYEDSVEVYGIEVWTPDDNREQTCCICGRTYCNCDALIDEARGK